MELYRLVENCDYGEMMSGIMIVINSSSASETLYGLDKANKAVQWILRQYALNMVNVKWATPLSMCSLSDATPGQSLTPLATTVTTICRLPESFVPSVTCLSTSVAFPLLPFSVRGLVLKLCRT